MIIIFNAARRFGLFNSKRNYSALTDIANKTEFTRLNDWECVVGLEVHAQINSRTKLFCRSPVKHNAAVNTCVGPFDSAHPGTLPVLNRYCVEAAIMTALALNATLSPVSFFDRKHYFYPDLPAGYQITQQRVPLARDGHVHFLVVPPGGGLPYLHSADLVQLQIEEDSGKSMTHPSVNSVLVDLNRAGVGLMELVFGPCLRSSAEAAGLVRHLARTLRTLGVCTANMNEGAMRVDANVSVRRAGQPLGARTEIKNLNSVRFLEEAINYEMRRQVEVIESGGQVTTDTRSFDPDTSTTRTMRTKEGLQDYRFLPEPNLPPLRVYDSEAGDVPPTSSSHGCLDATDLRRRLPPLLSLSSETLQLLRDTCRLPNFSLQIIVNHPSMCEFYVSMIKAQSSNEFPQEGSDKAASETDRVKEVKGGASGEECEACAIAANLLIHCVREFETTFEGPHSNWPVSTDQVWEAASLVHRRLLKEDRAKDVLKIILQRRDTRSPHQVAAAEGWLIHTDMAEVMGAVRAVLDQHQDLVSRYEKHRLNPKKKVRPFNQLSKTVRERLGGGDTVDMEAVEGRLRAVLDGDT